LRALSVEDEEVRGIGLKRVAILGCTGSIGTQAIEVIRHHPAELQIVGLAAHSNHALVAQQAVEFKPKLLAMYDPVAAERLGQAVGNGVGTGMDGLLEIASDPEVDIVVVSVSGMIGLEPTLSALAAGKEVALASKEVLVAGGEIVAGFTNRDEGGQRNLRPIDSEHSAILQCLNGEKMAQVDQLILTASGGPFRGRTRQELEAVTVEQALNHPTWRMGGKITIDSATLMNKGLELIEACWLFEVAPEQVEVVVHPQSVIHSMVKFKDGSVLAQMGHPDMKLPIQYALLGPDRLASPARSWEPLESPDLTFEPVRSDVFPAIEIAREAIRKGGLTPCFMNAVNEEAANAFLRQEIGFLDILEAAESSIDKAPSGSVNLESILQADAEARATWRSLLRNP
jgi:1-deoxy-D-xylulose-5-phosphate reductoisomerase